ncbi:MAG: glycosyltransferase [Nitrospirae bacterium]|nr:glycosyltransferase [Nitrospirota bacterium]
MDKRLTILQVIYSFKMGGSERMASTIASGLDRSRFRPMVCGINGDGPLSDLLQKDDIPWFVLNRRDGKDWSMPMQLYRILRDERVDAVQTHHLGQLLYTIGPARLLGIPVIHTEHEYYTFLQRSRNQWIARWVLPLVWKTVVVGDDVGRFFVDRVGIAPERLEVIHQGIVMARNDLVDLTAIRTELGLDSSGGPVIGHVARLTAAKDQETLLRAFARVHQSLPAARLVMVGDGELRDRLVGFAANLGLGESVRFVGFRSDVQRLLPAFDLFVLSSHEEGLPISLLEAMAAGRPVVATAVGCIPELVSNGERGLVVPPRAPENLADAILKLLSDESARARYGEAGKQHVESRFSLSEMINRYESLYRRATDGRRRSCAA